MSFSEAISSVFNQYLGFSGRASRREYWFFTLFYLLVTAAASVIARLTGLAVVPGLWSLAVFLPSLALLFRRLHDSNKSAVWLLILLLPVIGEIVIFIFTLLPSDQMDNRYGRGPYSRRNPYQNPGFPPNQGFPPGGNGFPRY
ncbi:MAG: DUF805 domain-containing protein [Clostridiales bacterium]|nr:DUF805 domain-containing protein [Candidatus Blautia equi]